MQKRRGRRSNEVEVEMTLLDEWPVRSSEMRKGGITISSEFEMTISVKIDLK